MVRCLRDRKGQFGMHTYTSHVLPSYSKNQKAAKDLLRFMHKKENYDQWFSTAQGFYTPGTMGWETHKVWTQNPVMARSPLPVEAAQRRVIRVRCRNAKAAEVL